MIEYFTMLVAQFIRHHFPHLHNTKTLTEHFQGITSSCHASAIADHVTSTGHNLKWDHFEILTLISLERIQMCQKGKRHSVVFF